MILDRGNEYTQHEKGRFDASLAYCGEEIARTDGDIVIGYDKSHEKEISKWANEYGYEIEWR